MRNQLFETWATLGAGALGRILGLDDVAPRLHVPAVGDVDREAVSYGRPPASAEGVPAKVIAPELGVVEATVRNHIRAILVALGAHSHLGAVANARRRHLIE
jgi:hypothetical protein